MPVIWRIGSEMDDAMERVSFWWTHHHDERVPREEATVEIRYHPHRECTTYVGSVYCVFQMRSKYEPYSGADIALVNELERREMVGDPSDA